MNDLKDVNQQELKIKKVNFISSITKKCNLYGSMKNEYQLIEQDMMQTSISLNRSIIAYEANLAIFQK